MKTNKSFAKRIKVTKNGKLIARKTGQNHFNAKESGSKNRLKSRSINIVMTPKTRSRFVPKRTK